jgi:hypothetical protein
LKSKISIFMGMKPDAGGIKIRNGNEIWNFVDITNYIIS